MRASHSSLMATLLSLAAILSLGCDDATGARARPTTGAIAVTVSTAGADIDGDGYSLSVDGGGGQVVQPNRTFTVIGLSEGQHALTLSGAATNCTIAPPNPRTVNVTLGDTASAAFSVSCVAKTGSVRVITVTTGANLDPDGYSVYVDDPYYYGQRQSIATNGVVTFADIYEGDHIVGLDGVANNCTVGGGNPRTVSVTFNATVDVTFAIQCS